MKNPAITVIVPAYNTEQYLPGCIDSILAQTFTDFELLLVDDGSKDSSGAICDEYAANDARIQVFHIANSGVSAARNIGLDNAHGEWIIMCDSDDYWVDKTILQQLYDKAVTNDLDIVRGEYVTIDAHGNTLSQKDYSVKNRIAGKVIGIEEFVETAINGEFFLPLNLIRRDIIEDSRFDENMKFLEDMKLFMQILLHVKRAMYLPDTFYAYRKLQTSASSKPKISNVTDSFSMCDYYWVLAENNTDHPLASMCRNYSVMMYYWTFCTLASSWYYTYRKEIINQIKLYELRTKTIQRIEFTKVTAKVKFIIESPICIGINLLLFREKVSILYHKWKNILQ